MNNIKKLIIIITILVMLPSNALATNTDTAVLALASSQYFNILDANQTGLDLTTALSFEYYINNVTIMADSTNGRVISKYGANLSNDRSYIAQYRDNAGLKEVRFILNSNDSTNDAFSFPYDLGTSTWTRVGFSWDGSTKVGKMYINGAYYDRATGTNVASIQSGAGNFTIGADQTGSTNFIDAWIEDIRVWSDVRTDQEMTDNYNCSLVGNEAGLVMYTQFDGSTSTDATANGNDLTNNNSATFQSGSLPFTATCGEATRSRMIMIN